MRRLMILGALAALVVLFGAAVVALRDVPAAPPVQPQQQEAWEGQDPQKAGPSRQGLQPAGAWWTKGTGYALSKWQGQREI